jgi:hypothetical protein
MIIKYRSNERWSWVSRVDEVREIGTMPVSSIPLDDYPAKTVTTLGHDDSSDPYVISVSCAGEEKILAIHASEAYLTDEATGNTIEILIARKASKLRDLS